MAASEELLHVDPKNAFSSFVINKDKDAKTTQRQQPPSITRVEASSVLNRVKNFLPVMASANQHLEKEIKESSPSKFNIEDVDESENYIEMNIGMFAKGNEETGISSSEESDSELLDEDSVCKMLEGITEKNLKIRKEDRTIPSMITEIETSNKHMVTRTKLKKKVVPNRKSTQRKNKRKLRK